MARTIEQIRKIKREHMARKRAADPQASRDYQKRFYHLNREQRKASGRQYYARRFFWGRANKLHGEGRATFKQIASMWKLQRGRCALTGRKMDRTAQLDHIIPKARGGTDEIQNLRWTCEAVNIAKRHMLDAEFFELCRDVIDRNHPVLKWIGERIAAVDAIGEGR